MKKLIFILALVFSTAAAAQTPSYLACTGSGPDQVCSTAGTLGAGELAGGSLLVSNALYCKGASGNGAAYACCPPNTTANSIGYPDVILFEPDVSSVAGATLSVCGGSAYPIAPALTSNQVGLFSPPLLLQAMPVRGPNVSSWQQVNVSPASTSTTPSCLNTGSATAFVCTIPSFSLIPGETIAVATNVASGTAPTLNVSGTGAYAMTNNSHAAIPNGLVTAGPGSTYGGSFLFTWDSTGGGFWTFSGSAAVCSIVAGCTGASTIPQGVENLGGLAAQNNLGDVANAPLALQNIGGAPDAIQNFSAPPPIPYIMPTLNGVYYPTLTTSNLTSATGLSNATVTYKNSGGSTVGTATGVVATVAGTPGTANIPLPAFNVNNPGRINIHVCIGSSTTSADTNALNVYFSNGANSSGGLWLEVNMSSIVLEQVTAPVFVAGSTYLNGGYPASGGIPSGTCGSVFMDWIGTGPGGLDVSGSEYYWVGWEPDNLQNITNPTGIITAIAPTTYQPQAFTGRIALTSTILSAVNQIYISDASANTMVTGVYVSNGRLDGPVFGNLGGMPTPGFIQPVVLNVQISTNQYPAEVWIPPTYGDPAGNPVAQMFNPTDGIDNVSNGVVLTNGNPPSPVAANLVEGGYIVIGLGSAGGYGGSGTAAFSPTNSDWGGPSGSRYRNLLLGLVRQLLPNASQYFRMCPSMGGVTCLDDEIRHPGGAAIEAWSPGWNLTAAYNLPGSGLAPDGSAWDFGYPLLIEAGFGTTWQSLISGNLGNDPATNPTDWLQIGTTLGGLPLGAFNPWAFTVKDLWVNTTSYGVGDIVFTNYTGPISGLSSMDPNLNYGRFASIPIQSWSELNDSTIPSSIWQTQLIAGVTAAGNTEAFGTVLTDCPTSQSCHLQTTEFNPTNNQPWNTTTAQSPTLAWFNQFRTAWQVTTGQQTPVPIPTLAQLLQMTNTGSNCAAPTLNTATGVINIPPCSPSGIALGTAAQIPVMNSGATAFAAVTLSGDCTLTPAGAITCTKSSGAAFGTAAFDTGPSGAIVGTTDTQTLTNKTLDGVTPTIMGYVDATSSIQTQLNTKAACTAGTTGSDCLQLASGLVPTGNIPSQYKTWTCQPGLGDGTNAITAATYTQFTCRNDSGVALAITGLACLTDNNGSSTMNATDGSGNALLTGAITCSNSWAAGTLGSTTTIASGGYVKFTFVADGTSKQTTFDIHGTY